MAGLNVSKWQASRRKAFYDPTLQLYLRLIRTGLDEAKAVKGAPPFEAVEVHGRDVDVDLWDRAIMARDWIAREAPDRKFDEIGYLLSFEHCCEVLGLNADYEATWMLREIDECGDFDLEGVHERIAYLIANPPDEVEEELFESFRVVPKLDQGNLFGIAA